MKRVLRQKPLESNMITMKTPRNLLLVIFLCLTACAPLTTPPKATMTPTQSPILTVDDIETMVTKPNYLAGCKILSKTIITKQIDYSGVIPGKSTDHDVISLLGDEMVKVFNSWVFDNGVTVTFAQSENPVVDLILIDRNPALAKIASSVLDMVGKYGCPKIIYAYDPTMDRPFVEYEVTVFAYPTIGIEFYAPDYPVDLKAKPDEVIIFVSETLSDYLLENTFIYSPSGQAMVVSWDEAVAK